MTTEEFSNEFDVMIASYAETISASQGLLKFDEYEKSVFLTTSEYEFVRELYTGNRIDSSFEKTEEMRRSLDSLVISKKVVSNIDNDTKGFNDAWNSAQLSISDAIDFDDKATDFNLWFITLELCDIENEEGVELKNIPVIPVTQDELHRTLNNPFRGTSTRRVLRMDLGDNKTQLLMPKGYFLKEYRFRGIRKPKPIILVNLPDELTIEGIQDITECELNTLTHKQILDIAVRMAIASRVQGDNSRTN